MAHDAIQHHTPRGISILSTTLQGSFQRSQEAHFCRNQAACIFNVSSWIFPALWPLFSLLYRFLRCTNKTCQFSLLVCYIPRFSLLEAHLYTKKHDRLNVQVYNIMVLILSVDMQAYFRPETFFDSMCQRIERIRNHRAYVRGLISLLPPLVCVFNNLHGPFPSLGKYFK